ncbi:hypothetical protein HYALB_00011315 [Hymenoscyphus albidus]|uniref:Uncharacterized protein n=1 Tax=Hymenoscyphus albidus TaxID=595503 RepID=A0A9N9PRL6_9HELO|nr:hypothetical protein HYALB_00011315 [Hymenoscyphus albidus]
MGIIVGATDRNSRLASFGESPKSGVSQVARKWKGGECGREEFEDEEGSREGQSEGNGMGNGIVQWALRAVGGGVVAGAGSDRRRLERERVGAVVILGVGFVKLRGRLQAHLVAEKVKIGTGRERWSATKALSATVRDTTEHTRGLDEDSTKT